MPGSGDVSDYMGYKSQNTTSVSGAGARLAGVAVHCQQHGHSRWQGRSDCRKAGCRPAGFARAGCYPGAPMLTREAGITLLLPAPA